MNPSELSDHEAAEVLAESLGKLPLALEQAQGYMEMTRCSPSRYLTLFEKRRKLLKRDRALTSKKAILTTTWEISLQEFKKTSPAAADLMRLCAFTPRKTTSAVPIADRSSASWGRTSKSPSGLMTRSPRSCAYFVRKGTSSGLIDE